MKKGYLKILVATTKTQGRRGDFCFVPEGEVVTFGHECDGETIMGSCGCKRSMVGVKGRKATTTMRVVEKRITKVGLAKVLKKSMKAGGFKITQAEALVEADCLLDLAKGIRLGVTVERRGWKFIQRVTKVRKVKG